ncbi:MAG: hypothetical protein COA44_00360 [Arcobacter sp.]|nr:MAG: hypothetical protein COA44_00360 [Arcobacter sp.]
MRYIFLQIALVLLLISPSFTQELTSAKLAYEDMEKTLGLTPTFLRLYPESAISGAWEAHKNLASKGVIPAKYKEMMGLAVASQVPCTYCVYFHTKALKMHKASDEEIKESVAIAAQTRKWSTVINGADIEYGWFKKDVDLVVKYLSAKDKPKMAQKDGEYALTCNDITTTFGRVPMFLEAYPKHALAGAWKDLKALQLSKTSIPGKYKQLLAVGISAQIPCKYCVYFHKEMAKLNGASKAEIQEMIAIAAETRQWSTYINGMGMDYEAFTKEVDLIFMPKQ